MSRCPCPVNKSAASFDVPDPTSLQDSVTLLRSWGSVASIPNYYPLELGNHALGGGFYATRFVSRPAGSHRIRLHGGR